MRCAGEATHPGREKEVQMNCPECGCDKDSQENCKACDLRDRFAMAALSGLMYAEFFAQTHEWVPTNLADVEKAKAATLTMKYMMPKMVASTCYEMADAMLKARSGK